jgi:hypothetical protein
VVVALYVLAVTSGVLLSKPLALVLLVLATVVLLTLGAAMCVSDGTI